METGVFTQPEIAQLLSDNYVEARLHLESFQDAGGAVLAKFVALREKYADGNTAMPIYVAVDPVSGRKLGTLMLGGPSTWVESITRFLTNPTGE